MAVPKSTPGFAALNPGYGDGFSKSAPFRPQPHHNVYAADFVALGHLRQLADDRVSVRNIDQIVLVLDEEVVVVRDVGVEIGLRAVDRHFSQQPGTGELMKRIVDRGERHSDLGAACLFVKHFRGQVTVALANKSQPRAMRWRVGRSPTSRRSAWTSC